MSTIGIRHLRRHAADVLRTAEAGETIVIAVSGREVAELGPVHRYRWRSGTDIASIFSGPPDRDWAEDRNALDATALDPFTR
ncbi:MAG: hypothetical protein QOE53_510 [Pseudonocardiales bacterium]|nr:hypothetical protein [Pseudonocardiales bacterium]